MTFSHSDQRAYHRRHRELEAALRPQPNFLDDDILASKLAREMRDVPAQIILLAVRYEWARRKVFNVSPIGQTLVPPRGSPEVADVTQASASATEIATQEFAA